MKVKDVAGNKTNINVDVRDKNEKFMDFILNSKQILQNWIITLSLEESDELIGLIKEGQRLIMLNRIVTLQKDLSNGKYTK